MHKSHRVTIEYPPDELSITGWNENDVFLEGSIQKIKCSAMTGNPLPKLTWKVDGGSVDDQDSSTLDDEDGSKISVSNEMTVTISRSVHKLTLVIRSLGFKGWKGYSIVVF